MSGPPLVCFVLVNWRTEQFLDRALASIAAQTHVPVRTVLVNNASPTWDGRNPGGGTELIHAPRNLGFAGGNNLGITQAMSSGTKPEFICLLNCDAWVAPEFTASALADFAANPRIGSVVPKLRRDDGSGRLESCGHQMYLDRTTGHRGHDEPDLGQYDRGQFVFGGSAAAVVYRAAMLEELAEGRAHGRLQVFDEAFFAYFEDVDLDWRAQRAGWQAYYDPACLAWHRAHGSGGRKRWLLQLRAEKNRYLMLVKNDRLSGLALGAFLTYEAYHFARWLLKPWLWPGPLLFLCYLPSAMRKRTQRCSKPVDIEQRWFIPRGRPAAPDPCTPNRTRPDPVPGLVSVIVLNYNGLELTRECLRSLLEQTYPNIEVILVDNGSSEAERTMLVAEQSDALLLPRNLGFAGGVDWAASRARGEYIALVNNDALLAPSCIALLIERLGNSDAAVSGRLVNVGSLDDARTVLQSEDFGPLPRGLAAALQESLQNHGLSLFGYIVPGLYGARSESFYPSGGLCLLRRSAVDDLLPNLFPPLYFAYHEDVWLGLRLRSAGHTVAKEPLALAAHIEASTARKLGATRLRFLHERNRWLNILGFYPASVILRLLPLLLVQALAADALALLTAPRKLLGQLGARVWLLAYPLAVARHRRYSWRGACVPAAAWLSELSGTLRGRGGFANALALAWCKLVRIPCRESSKLWRDGRHPD